MILEEIVLQSAGSLAVAILGLLMVVLQISFCLKKPDFRWFGWSAAISFAGMLYAVGIFFEYNSPAGALNRSAGMLEFTAVILLVHCLFGFTFSYFGLDGRRYHLFAGAFHVLVFIFLWSTDDIVAQSFAARDFIWLNKPYIEPALGPFGPLFEFYAVGSSIFVIVFWLRYKGPDAGYRYPYVVGMLCWILFGFHDALASLGMPSVQYFMEYGYFSFSAVVLWVLFSSYVDASTEDKYRVITEHTNDGILVIQNGKTVFGNPAADILMGKPVGNIGVEALLRDITPQDRAHVLQYFNYLFHCGEAPDSLTVRFMEGKRIEKVFEVRGNSIRYRNKSAILTVLRDVTERIREEEARKENEEKIFRLKKMESLGLLAGGVAHDLNNVLSGIINYPELLLMNLPENSSLRKPLETIKNSGMKAVAIVQDLLTVARGVAIVKEPSNLNAAIQGYLKSPEHKKLLQYHPKVTVRAHLDDNLLNIKGSMVHIGKVVMNLVSNAAEAIKGQGTVVISTENRHLDAPLKGYENVNAGDYVVLVVSDDGPGISPEDLGRIFEPFFTKKAMGRSGTGIGLTLVWNVMQDHDGYINVMSDFNGTTFEVYFPVTREISRELADSQPLEDLFGKGQSVLVIDDVESQRDISCRMLEILKYRTKAVSSGEAAVEYLKTHRVDLLLLDMIMDPGISGRETYERIIGMHPGQKAVIVSGFSETSDVRETQKLGAGRYLKKPILLDALGVAVKEALGEKLRKQ